MDPFNAMRENEKGLLKLRLNGLVWTPLGSIFCFKAAGVGVVEKLQVLPLVTNSHARSY